MEQDGNLLGDANTVGIRAVHIWAHSTTAVQWTFNPTVGGSNPSGPTKFDNQQEML